MAKLSPSRISTVVEVSRRREGVDGEPLPTEMPFRVDRRHGRVDRQVDDVAIDDRGVKFSSTPKGLYST
jgi:hypothetical protein